MKLEPKPNGELARPGSSSANVPAVSPRDPSRGVSIPRPGAVSASAGGTVSVMSLLRALRRRSVLALGVAILAALAVAPAAWYLVPSAKYRAQASLQVVAQPPKVLFQTMEAEADDYRRYQSTQQTLVRSRLVLNAALAEKEVSGYQMLKDRVDPIAWLQNELKIDFLSGSEVMEISLSGDFPEELAGLVNAVKKAYMDEVVDVNIKQRIARHAKLKQIKDRYVETLKEKRATLRKLAETVGSDDRQTLG